MSKYHIYILFVCLFLDYYFSKCLEDACTFATDLYFKAIANKCSDYKDLSGDLCQIKNQSGSVLPEIWLKFVGLSWGT